MRNSRENTLAKEMPTLPCIRHDDTIEFTDDEFIDEFHEHIYRANERRRIFRAKSVISLALVCIATVLILGLALGFTEENAMRNTHPAYLYEKCRLKGEECEEMCKPAKCCFVAENHAESCRREHKETCQHFVSACYSAFNVTLEVPPLELTDTEKQFIVKTACSDHVVLNSARYFACAHFCSECCFDEAAECYERNRHGCDDFSSCKILFKDESLVIDSVFTDAIALETLCAHGLTKYDEEYSMCKKLCGKLQCCLEFSSDKCYPYNPTWCETYNACTNTRT